MKIHGLSELFQLKMDVVEFVKDSPLILYIAFYEPFYDWLKVVATDWNPVLQFFLNLTAIAYGVARLVPIVKSWGKEDPPHNDSEH